MGQNFSDDEAPKNRACEALEAAKGKAYRLGCEAAKGNRTYEDNPYVRGTPLSNEWKAGYEDESELL